MDAQQALADLTEISSQIEAAVVFDDQGKVAGSTLAEGGRADELAKAAAALLAAAEEVKTGESVLTQLEVSTGEGSVFVVRDGKTSIAATTGGNPTAGLVFYDLKSALRSVKPAAKSAPAKKKTATAAKKRPPLRPPRRRQLHASRRRGRSRMRRSIAAALGVAGGMLAGAAFIRRQGASRERADLYFEDGSMLSLTNGSPGAERLLPLAREVIRNARAR